MMYLIMVLFMMLILVAGQLYREAATSSYAMGILMLLSLHLLSTDHQHSVRAIDSVKWYNKHVDNQGEIMNRPVDISATPAEELYLEEMYNRDSSFAYECSSEDLERLLLIFGEMEPIIDAFNVRSGASIEQRALDIGCSPDDFRSWV